MIDKEEKKRLGDLKKKKKKKFTGEYDE